MAAPKKNPAPSTGGAPGLRVVSTSPLGSIRRAGLWFHREPTVIGLESLKPWQLEAIKAEPMLDVTECELEPAPAPAES